MNVLKDGDRITGVVINNKDGMSVIEAKIISDCSGNADVATWAGVNYITGSFINPDSQSRAVVPLVSNQLKMPIDIPFLSWRMHSKCRSVQNLLRCWWLLEAKYHAG